MKKKLAGASLAAAMMAVGGGAHAQAISNPSGVVPNYNVEQIETLLNDLGVTHQRGQRSSDGGTFILATVGNLRVILDPRACNTGNCKGLRMLLVFNDLNVTAAEANDFNSVYFPATVFKDDASSAFQRYLIGDYGYTRGAFAVNLGVFTITPSQFNQFRNQRAGLNTISFESLLDAPEGPKDLKPGEPAPGDDMADQLNSLAKINNAGSPDDAPLRVQSAFAPYFDSDPVSLADYPEEAVNEELPE